MLAGRKILGLGREPINLSGGRLARVGYAPITDKIARRSEMTRCAKTGREQVQQHVVRGRQSYSITTSARASSVGVQPSYGRG